MQRGSRVIIALRARLESFGVLGLFPPVPAPRSRRNEVLAMAALVLLGPVTVALRQRGSNPLQSLWAEDGKIYLSQARGEGLHSIWTAYAGYGQLLPRLVSLITRIVPLRDAGIVISGGAALSASVLAAVLVAALRGFVPSLWLRIGAALFVLLVPIGEVELIAVLANVQWFLLAVCFWVLLWRPPSRLGALVAFVVGLITFGSAPLALLLLPLLVLRGVALPWREQAVTLGVVVACIYQGAVMLTTSRPETTIRPAAGQLAESYLARVVLGLLGPTNADSVYFHLRSLSLIIATLIVGGVVACIIARPGRRWLVAACLVLGGGNLAFAEYYSWSPSVVPTGRLADLGFESRYAVLAVTTMVVLLVVALSDSRNRPAGERPVMSRLYPTVLSAVLVAVAIGVVTDFRGGDYRKLGPTWHSALTSAAATCSRRHQTTVDVTTTPLGWYAELACPDVESAAQGLAKR